MNIRNELQRHGWKRLAMAYPIKLMRKFTEVSLAEVSLSNNFVDYPIVDGYENRLVDERGYNDAIAANEIPTDDRSAAFQRGDYCVATFYGAKMAGYNFYGAHATPVTRSTEFVFSDRYLYSYAAFTAPQYRGLGLSPSRWTYFRQWRIENDINKPTIHYVDVSNLSSLASGEDDRLVVGYTGYLKVGSHVWHWSSPGCRREQAGFRPTLTTAPQVPR